MQGKAVMNVSGNSTQVQPDLQISFIPWAFFNSLIIVFGVVGNLLVILAYRNPRMKTVTNLFIANLAFADLNVALINVPFNIIKTKLDYWPFGVAICKVVASLLGITLAASVGSLIAIAADRHRAIVHPLKPRMRTRHAFYIIIAIWIAAVFVAIPTLVFTVVNEEGACLEVWPQSESVHWEQVYTYFIFVALYILPLGAICGLYFMIYHNLMRKEPLQKSKSYSPYYCSMEMSCVYCILNLICGQSNLLYPEKYFTIFIELSIPIYPTDSILTIVFFLRFIRFIFIIYKQKEYIFFLL